MSSVSVPTFTDYGVWIGGDIDLHERCLDEGASRSMRSRVETLRVVSFYTN